LGWICTTAGQYKITLSDWDGIFLTEQTAFIRDQLTGTTTDLKLTPYTFTSETGVFNNRFTLVYKESLTTIDQPIDSKNILVFKENGYYHVITKGSLIKNISIFDMLGRLVYKVNDINSESILIKEIHQTKEILLLKIVDDKLQTYYRKILN
jgi:hypothetical protein